jgi:hypothetical protein
LLNAYSLTGLAKVRGVLEFLENLIENKVKFIINQKWIAMNGTQNVESWTELRRTGYPNFLKPSASSILPSGIFPSRLLWPDAEITTNPNVPSNNNVEVKVWWDNY